MFWIRQESFNGDLKMIGRFCEECPNIELVLALAEYFTNFQKLNIYLYHLCKSDRAKQRYKW